LDVDAEGDGGGVGDNQLGLEHCMATHTNEFVLPFNYSAALELKSGQRMKNKVHGAEFDVSAPNCAAPS
jgi:hypothetical protein